MGDAPNVNRYQAILTGFLLASTVVTACGGGSAQPSASPEPNIMIPFEPTPTPQIAVDRTESPSTPTADSTPTAADDPIVLEAARVLWVRTSHAGPGVVTIRFETNVPTTAEVRVMTNQVGPAFFFSGALAEETTLHATSVPANAFGRYTVRVEDKQGNVAWATLRYQQDAQGIDWATGNFAPSLSPLSAKKLAVEWAFPKGHPSKLGLEGTVRAFSTPATCTTADACVGEPLGEPLEAPAQGDGELESHAAEVGISGSSHDYQVIIGQPLNETSSSMVFLQLDIRGDQLPKTNFPAGPGTIKN